MLKPTVYIETTVVSYLVSRPSREPLIRGQQEATQRWWREHLDRFTPFVSVLVLEEAANGDAAMARARLEALKEMQVLENFEQIAVLAAAYMKRIGFPDAIRADAYHMASATWHRIDYLATWNCKHIAAGWVRRLVKETNDRFGLSTPEMCTPLELMEPSS